MPPRTTALGLHALQHRGQEAAGIVSFDGRQFHAHRGARAMSATIFSAEPVIDQAARATRRSAMSAIPPPASRSLRNVQPLFADFDFGGFAVAHNGNLTNAYAAHAIWCGRGSLFQSTTDTEVIIHLIATSCATASPSTG